MTVAVRGVNLRHHERLRGARNAAALASRLGFEALLGDRLRELSKGSLHKVVIAQAFLGSPALIVLDEPFSALDADARVALAALIGERSAAGAAVALSDRGGGARDGPHGARVLAGRRGPGGMIAVARYLLAGAVRGRAVVAPVALLAAVAIVLYAAPPNPVPSSARTAAVYTSPIQVWLALAVLNAAAAADRLVLAATVGRPALAGGRLLAAATTVGAALLMVAYPVFAGRFDHAPTATQLAACAGTAAGAALAATALAAVFARPGVRHPAVTALGPASAVLLALALPPVVDAALLAGAATLACVTRWE